MEPRKIETSKESRGEGQTAPPRQRERKRRFQIIKLEERIAPCQGGNGTNNGCFHSGAVVCNCASHKCCG
jgi:hypothetical protein